MHDDFEVFFEHHGVKGQKWGVRRKQNRALNKASRARDKAAGPQFTAPKVMPKAFSPEYKKAIDTARANVRSGKTDFAVKQARHQYKQDKIKLGSREAKKILRAVKEKSYDEHQTAAMAKDGKEVVLHLLGAALSSGLKAKRPAR